MNTTAYRTGQDVRAAFDEATEAFRNLGVALRAHLGGWPIIRSPHVTPGDVIYADGAIYMHPRDAIRRRYPDTITGALATSLEWQHYEINRAADAARQRIDTMHPDQPIREDHLT
ncbi:hypothetical protein [Microbacterium karelineae]|uniref:hypothetical protein n=1 Tax=Microbacterium karelineae TaxID=2654283 RepID=UPI0012EA6AD0|nr:hypothetical protein [Microbacterium karelineae]